MKYKVMYTAGAKRDLRNIFRYISEELLAPQNAARQTKRIMTAIRKLDTMANRNRLYEEEPWHSRKLRFFPVDNYLVFYKADDIVLLAKSERGAKRLLETSTKYLEGTLKLKVNQEKSRVVSVFAIRNFKFLGFTLGKNRKGIYVRVHGKSWEK